MPNQPTYAVVPYGNRPYISSPRMSSASGPWMSSASGVSISSFPVPTPPVPSGEKKKEEEKKEEEVQTPDDGVSSRFELMELEE